MKDVGLRIRIQRSLREEFLRVCKAQDKSAAQVIREFMRNYVIDHNLETPPDQQTSSDGSTPATTPSAKSK
jgi:hypothetical protein